MNREITILDLPRDLRHRDQIPKDWEAGPLCSRQDVMAALIGLGHAVDRSCPSRQRIELGLGQFLDLTLGDEELLFSLRLRFGPSDHEAREVARLLESLGFQALEPRSETGLFHSDRPRRARIVPRAHNQP